MESEGARRAEQKRSCERQDKEDMNNENESLTRYNRCKT